MIRNFELDKNYDYSLDICTITVKDDFNFGKSLEIEDGVILDFDENNIPISIEILDISLRLGVKKSEIKSSDVSMKILCSEDILEITIDFYYKIEEKEFNQTFDSKIVNKFNIPSMQLASVDSF